MATSDTFHHNLDHDRIILALLADFTRKTKHHDVEHVHRETSVIWAQLAMQKVVIGHVRMQHIRL